MNLKTKLLIGIFIVSGLVGTSACSITNNKSETTPTITEGKAKEIAVDALKGGEVINSHLDKVTNNYEVYILKGQEHHAVDVDSLTGKVLGIEKNVQSKNNLNNVEGKLQNVSPKIPLEDAKLIALDSVKGTIMESELGYLNNSLVYYIVISKTYHHEVNVIVDATNGKVLKVEDVTY